MSQPISRRRFIGQGACAGVGLTGLLSAMGTLRLFNASLSAQSLPEDYRTIVCLFLYGGNDGNNMIVPTDTTGYNAYANTRGILAIPQSSLLPITTPNSDGRQYGLHPGMARLQPVFNAGRMAMIANVGTLVAPITKAEYLSGGAAVPPYLFSHIDQQGQWQTSVPDSAKKIGWGGRLADLTQSLNEGSQISMNISLAGNNFFQTGNQVFEYSLSPDGSAGLQNYTNTGSPNPTLYGALQDTLGMSYSHLFEAQYANILKRAISSNAFLTSTLLNIPAYTEKFTNSVDSTGKITSVGSQLKMILRMISARSSLSMKRQIFFCSVGGFDTHDNQLTNQNALLKQVSDAVADFYQGTVDLGISDKVTLFTASDFNRTYTTNGKGSDHAWGSHQFVVGGAVQGAQIYGSMPVLQASGPDDTGARGSWIPTTSVDEYSATLAKWFGVSASDMPSVLPNIRRFARPDMGFMG